MRAPGKHCLPPLLLTAALLSPVAVPAAAPTPKLPGAPDVPAGRKQAVQSLLEAGPSTAVARIFARFDHDGDGRLSMAELVSLQSPAGFETRHLPVDVDHGGFVEPAEFLASFLQLNPRQPPDRSLVADRFIAEGNRLRHKGDLKQALQVFARATESCPECVTAWYTLGTAREEDADLAGARAAFERALKLDPADAFTLLQLSVVENRLGQAGHSRELEGLGLQMLARRKLLMGGGRPPEMELERYESVLLGLVSYYSDQAGQPSHALELVRWFERKLGASWKVRLAGAWALANLERYNEALDSLKAGLESPVERPQTLAVKGHILMRTGDYRGAASTFRQVLAAKPRGDLSWESSLDLFEALARGGCTTETGGMIDDLLRQADMPVRRNRLATVLCDAGFAERAIDLLRDILSRNPGNPDIWLRLADLLGSLGDDQGRREALEQALAHGWKPPAPGKGTSLEKQTAPTAGGATAVGR